MDHRITEYLRFIVGERALNSAKYPSIFFRSIVTHEIDASCIALRHTYIMH